MNNNIVAVQGIQQETNQRLDKIETRLDSVETEIKEVKQVLEKVDSTISKLGEMYENTVEIQLDVDKKIQATQDFQKIKIFDLEQEVIY